MCNGKRFYTFPFRTRSFLIMVLFFSLAGFTRAQTFTDVAPDKPYFQAVENGVQRGYLAPEEKFLPEQKVSRAEMAKTLSLLGNYQLEEGPQLAVTSSFLDLPEGQWYSQYIKTLLAWQIARGYLNESGQPTGYFRPENPVTLNEAAVMLNRILKLTPQFIQNSPFNGLNQDHWAYQDRLALYQAGIIKELEEGNRPINRAEMAQMLDYALPWLGQTASIEWTPDHQNFTADLTPTLPPPLPNPISDFNAEIENQTVSFPGPDGLSLTGQLYKPEGVGPFPAVVFMHGCTGLMTGGRQTNGLGSQFIWWGEKLARDENTVALFVDSFGPRGIQRDICGNENILNEVTERPKDAYAGLSYLKNLDYVIDNKIALMGWSNGGSAVLSAMAQNNGNGGEKFITGIAEYPGCGLRSHFGSDFSDDKKKGNYLPYAPVLILAGERDRVTPPEPRCINLVQSARELGASEMTNNPMTLSIYEGAEHSFDAPEEADSKANLAAQEASRNSVINQLRTVFK